MAGNMSLADQAVHALAMVRAMDEGVGMEQPERHAIRSLKRVAEYALTDAFRLAQDLAFQAQDLSKLAREIESADKPHNVKVRGPEAALSPEAPARLPGSAADLEEDR